eukprot:gnl/Chilomastix_caulleri/5253.p2 GENE.gnl/Chilomastix_caulleri/5253~~gnl/Chilomastix_caulleri/5253.p2  ORF type:complete len:67 (-),score=12.20 gnl/Chilomastix_caulleri/5253:16-216(-)
MQLSYWCDVPSIYFECLICLPSNQLEERMSVCVFVECVCVLLVQDNYPRKYDIIILLFYHSSVLTE